MQDAPPVAPEERGAHPTHDVFLSYHAADRERVKSIKDLLIRNGITAFLDRDDLIAGLPWPQALESALRSVRAVLVFVGSADGGDSLGLWQRREVWFALDHQAHKEGQGAAFPVIPVLLPGSHPEAGFLFLNTWVDVRNAANESAAVEDIVNAVSRHPVGPAVAAATVCPYRALEEFREEHAALFFGRESFASDLLHRVLQRPLVALVGASGTGKSSVVQAGLVPLLRRQRPPEGAWDVVVFRPGDGPFHRLAASLVPLLEADADEVDRLALVRKCGDRLADGSIRLEDIVERLLSKSKGTDRLLIVADQFEELFTLTPSPQRRPLVAALHDALERAPLSVVLALRADFYGHAIGLDRWLSDQIQAGIVNLAPLTPAELRRAVERPAQRASIQFEAGLIDRLLDQFERQPGGLPLLEFALTQLWERRDGQRITHAAYDAIGEIEGAIGRRAETVFQTMNENQQRGASSLFCRLVRVASSKDAEPDTRRRVEVDTLTELELSVLQPFVNARLLVLDRGNSVERNSVELAHEALIQGWSRLVTWIDQEREFLLWRQRLGQAVAEWHRMNRNANAMLRGPALKEAIAWAHLKRDNLSQAEEEFVQRSHARQRRRRVGVSVAIALATLALGAVPAALLASHTNAGVTWVSIRLIAPNVMFEGVPPSGRAGWIHAMDVAGRLDELGGESLFADSDTRVMTLRAAAILVAHEGRTADAARLADRALAIAREIPDFDSSIGAQLGTAEALSWAGRDEAARPLALRALALGRQEQNLEIRGLMIADAADILARVGLKNDARLAVEEARGLLRTNRDPSRRSGTADSMARALVQLGDMAEARTLVGSTPEWTLSPSFVELLIDGEHFAEADELVSMSDDPLVMAALAAGLASAGRAEKARVMTRTSLAHLEVDPMNVNARDAARSDLYQRVLLKIMPPNEAATLVRESGNADGLATFAVVLARTGSDALAFEIAQEASELARGGADPQSSARIMVKIAEALATIGRPEPALSIARATEDRDLQTLALAHAAVGFAAAGQNDRARDLIREIAGALPTIRDRVTQSLSWAAVSIARIRLGDYSAIYERDGVWLNFKDGDGVVAYPIEVLRVATWIIRDAALRQDGKLRERFDRGPIDGLGRYGVHWP